MCLHPLTAMFPHQPVPHRTTPCPQVARNELQQKAAEAERRAKALGEQRDVLQQQLEKAAAERPGEGEWLEGGNKVPVAWRGLC